MRLLLGPAGSGKTFRCLTEIREALVAAPDGPPLLLLAPKQTTYQLERRLLADPAISGYTRLHILSVDRLAHLIFGWLGKASPQMLDEEGRLMVLRGLLAKKHEDLKLFRASARLTGFAQQLSAVLRELQRNELTPESLNQLAEQVRNVEGLAYKLQDLATLLQDYLGWLKSHNLQDADCLLASATEALRESLESKVSSLESARGPEESRPGLRIAGLWVDGFAEWSPQELELLAALLPYCEQATLTFCLDQVPTRKLSWLSSWSMVRKSFEECKKRFASVPGSDVCVQVLQREPEKGRFVKSPALQHLERFWTEPKPYQPAPASAEPEIPLRMAACASPEAEATLAAHEILRHVRSGGRFRDVTVLVRTLSGYHEPLQRVFSRFEIPFFLDRRESVAHHPLAELTRGALRTVVFQWVGDDWFAALKTGLVPAKDYEIDKLENEALARGWKGSIWQKPIVIPNDEEVTDWLADLHQRILPPFQRLALALASCQNKPTGPQLATALRQFWQALRVEQLLEQWAADQIADSEFRTPASVHATVWEQMNAWLANVELAFPTEALPVRDWLPVLEAGLANLSVGVIPPALDQVLIGTLDRSRNPEIKLALVLGLNESVFPAPPEPAVLLTDTDRTELEKRNLLLGANARQQLGRERFYAYIACTRARQRLVLTCALHDSGGSPRNPSPFLAQVQQLFPSLDLESVPAKLDWRDSQHASELIVPLLRMRGTEDLADKRVEGNSGLLSPARSSRGGEGDAPCAAGSDGRCDPPSLSLRPGTGALPGWQMLAAIPALASVLGRLLHFQSPELEESLAPELAVRLYGNTLRTSVSRMEQFAACPFKFFVHSGLRAEERKLFELDSKEQGTFQHDALALFHLQLRQEKKRWRDITPQEARQRIGQIAASLVASYRDGLLQASEESRFMARVLTESLQDFVETLVGWMRGQYLFDPVEVELPFGEDESCPAWAIPLSKGHRLELYGRIDRVDLYHDADGRQALCVVVDYKSSHKQLDPVLLANGLQLQLLTYLNVLRRWPNPQKYFNAQELVPAGVFYVSLRGKYERGANRLEAMADAAQARKNAYQHTGRFDARALPHLDARPDARIGDQFKYKLKLNGELYKNSREAVDSAGLIALLDSVETNLKQMGEAIYSGHTQIAPYRKGSATACDQCGYRSICRLDPWTHSFRILKHGAEAEEVD